MSSQLRILERAEEFIWRNARLLDRQRFAYHFKDDAGKDGAGAAVVAALRAYQNPDGGFGNALEPDLRGPDSQPVAVQHALEFLDETDFDDGDGAARLRLAHEGDDGRRRRAVAAAVGPGLPARAVVADRR